MQIAPKLQLPQGNRTFRLLQCLLGAQGGLVLWQVLFWVEPVQSLLIGPRIFAKIVTHQETWLQVEQACEPHSCVGPTELRVLSVPGATTALTFMVGILTDSIGGRECER